MSGNLKVFENVLTGADAARSVVVEAKPRTELRLGSDCKLVRSRVTDDASVTMAFVEVCSNDQYYRETAHAETGIDALVAAFNRLFGVESWVVRYVVVAMNEIDLGLRSAKMNSTTTVVVAVMDKGVQRIVESTNHSPDLLKSFAQAYLDALTKSMFSE